MVAEGGRGKQDCEWEPDNFFFLYRLQQHSHLCLVEGKKKKKTQSDASAPRVIFYMFFFLTLRNEAALSPPPSTCHALANFQTYVAYTRQGGSFHITAGFGYSRLCGWSLPYSYLFLLSFFFHTAIINCEEACWVLTHSLARSLAAVVFLPLAWQRKSCSTEYNRELNYSIVHRFFPPPPCFPTPFHLLNSQITSKGTLDAWR